VTTSPNDLLLRGNRRFAQSIIRARLQDRLRNSRNNGDDSHAEGADSHKQALMLPNIFCFKLRLNYLVYQLAEVHCLLILLIYVFIYNSKTHSFHCKIYSVRWSLVGAIPTELVSILPHALS